MHKRLEDFVTAMTQLVGDAPKDEPRILKEGSRLLGDLVRHDDWLEDRHAVPHAQFYQQYLLYRAPDDAFSVVSFVWGPGQSTPIHDHTVWGLIGMLRGAETAQHYVKTAEGRWAPEGTPTRLMPGQVEAVSPRIGDVHRVSNALANQTSISIHDYGANIGAVELSVYLEDVTLKPFVSVYSNT